MTSVGVFDVWFNDGDVGPAAFVTNVFTKGIGNGATVTVNSTETVVATFTTNSPDPAVFRHHCIPQ
jgi:hypothetical protein